MGFERLLGNEQLKENLASARARQKLSHFYLISGPEGSGRHTLADLIAAALICKEKDGPCGRCNGCRKVFSHTHPDYLLIDDPEKKTVSVDLIREARADVFIRPNEADRKVYLFPRAQDMGIPGQNALLKVLEEPPPYGVFLLITDNPDKILPTVRSRCMELKMKALPEALLKKTLASEFPQADDTTLSAAAVRSGGFLGQAREILSGASVSERTLEFARAYLSRDPYQLVSLLTPMEKLKRDVLIPLLCQWLELLEQAMVHRKGIPAAYPQAVQISAARNMEEMMAAAAALKQAIEYAQSNVSCAAVCGWLSWALR